MDNQIRQPMLGSGRNLEQRLQIETVDAGREPATHSFFKRNRNKGLVGGLIVAVVLCIILFIALCVSLLSGDELCLSQQCLRTASSLLQSIDRTVDPCDNFYNFVCGRWKEEHIVRKGEQKNNWFEERTKLLDKSISDFLRSDDYEDEPTSVYKAKAMYRACLDTDAMEEEGFETLLKVLQRVGLPSKPLIHKNRKSWDWISNVAKARKFLDMQILIGFTLGNLPSNTTIHKLSVIIPKDPTSTSVKSKAKDKFIVKREEGDDSDETEEKISNWKEETARFLGYFYNEDNGDSLKNKEELLANAAAEIVAIRVLLAATEKDDDVVKAKSNTLEKEMTVYELQELVDKASPSSKSKIKWLDYFDKLYANTSVTDVKSGLEKNETILIFNQPYYEKLSYVLSKFNDRQIGLFVWWTIVYELALNVNAELGDLRKQIDLVAGYEHDSREDYCTSTISTVMKPAIYYIVLDQPNIEQKFEKVEEMISNIKNAFKTLVKKLSWMDEITKLRTIEKVTAMDAVINYPDWMEDLNNFNTFYENVTVKEDTHLANLLQTYEADAMGTLEMLHEESTRGDLDPLDINAYYTQQENSVFVPAMILQFPFYDLGLQALNYGAIGVIIGHEVTHGFDDAGRFYNKDGNYHEWWTEESNREFNKRTQCYINKYGSYHIESVNKTIDGNRTLDENLADNGGLIEGFLAYKTYVATYGEEPKLPGFENYTHEQLFFMSYVHTWCAEYDGTDGILEDLDDEHSPEFVRTLITLQDSNEFSEAWNCPKGSNMNPSEEKCTLWTDK